MKGLCWTLLGVSCLISGCIVDTRHSESHAAGCGSGTSTTTVVYCAIDSDCASGMVCSENDTCVTGGPRCSADTNCAAGSYCDIAAQHCVTSTTCVTERDCAAGYNCKLERRTCEPAALPTCGEVTTENDCGLRADCRTVYAGVGCSCGSGCECQGGEPGCVCQSFEFFKCAPIP